MSIALLGSSTTNSATATPSRTIPPWMREPLLHFVLLGGVLFAIDGFIAAREDDPRTIVVDASVDREAIQVFKDARGREPSEEELYALRRVWLDNEVLYREGLALELDRGDKAIRERVIFKALSVVDAGVKLPAFDDAVLREWFERNRAKYDQPARYDFQEAVLSGNRNEAAVRAFVAALNAGAPGDAEAGLRVFTDRPHANLVQSYGAEFAAALEVAPQGEWRAITSKDGLRAIRLHSIAPPQPADFDVVRGVVLQDWTDAVMAEQRSGAVRALAKKYTVKVDGET
jgi:PPIC-type PPIASE domain